MPIKTIVSASMLVIVTACGGQGNSASTPAPEVIEGQIRIAGSEPATMVMLRPASGGAEIRLAGAHLDELHRLAGVVVSVSGEMGPSDMQGFAVRDYEITSIQGRRPSVGTLVDRDGSLWLDGDTSVRLVDVPDGMLAQVGAKVWILGTLVDGALRTETYGVIREPR